MGIEKNNKLNNTHEKQIVEDWLLRKRWRLVCGKCNR
jgi:hypothetical protein